MTLKRIIHTFVLTIILCLVASLEAHAEYKLKGKFDGLNEIFSNSNQSDQSSQELASTITFSGRNIQGRFRVKLTEQKFFNYLGEVPETNVRYLQGVGTFRSRTIQDKINAPVTVEITKVNNSQYRIRSLIVDKGIGHGRDDIGIPQMYFLVDTSEAQTKFIPLYTNRDKKSRPAKNCGTPHPLFSLETQTENNNPTAKQTFSQLSILLERDQDWNSKAGAGETPELMIATADTWYKRDLGITLAATIVSEVQSYSSQIVLDQTEFTFPIHNEMRSNRPAESRTEEVHYLLTGKRGGGDLESLAGAVPNLGTVCKTKEDSIGFTIYFAGDYTDTIVTTAHEVGHLLSAEHDDAHTGSEGYIMNAGTQSVNSYVNEFSAFSKQQVAAHIAANNSCLGSAEGEIGTTGGDSGGDTGGGSGGDGDGGSGNNELTAITIKKATKKKVKITTTPKGRFELTYNCTTNDQQSVSGSFTTKRKGKKFKKRQLKKLGLVPVGATCQISGGNGVTANFTIPGSGGGSNGGSSGSDGFDDGFDDGSFDDGFDGGFDDGGFDDGFDGGFDDGGFDEGFDGF